MITTIFGAISFRKVNDLHGTFKVIGYKEFHTEKYQNAVSVFYPSLDTHKNPEIVPWLSNGAIGFNFLRAFWYARLWMSQPIDANRPSDVPLFKPNKPASFWDYSWVFFFLNSLEINVSHNATLLPD